MSTTTALHEQPLPQLPPSSQQPQHQQQQQPPPHQLPSLPPSPVGQQQQQQQQHHHHHHHPPSSLSPSITASLISPTSAVAIQQYTHDNPHPFRHHHHHQMTYHNMFTPSRDPGNMWRCRSCSKEVTNRWHHYHSHTAQRSMCPYCPATYSRIDTLRSHLRVKHANRLMKH